MSEINVYPPPPPPPPPSRPASSMTFDFVEPFAFVFQDERWPQKVLIGGLFYIASIFLIGIFFVLGYSARLTRNVIAGMARPLPEWDDLGTYLSDGVKLFCVMLLYALPLMAIALAFLIPAGIFSAMAQGRNELAQWASGVTLSCIWCLFFPISLALSFWMPAALMFAIIDDRIGAAFELRRIFNYLRNNFVNYLLAFLVLLVARFAVPFGAIALCIGVFFTAFWAVIVATYGFAQAYRLSPTK